MPWVRPTAPPILFTRDAFRERVFARDRHCVACYQPAADAHHLIERRLWPDGGYYLENGVALCGDCHRRAESTELDAGQLRQLAALDVVHPLLPPGWPTDEQYDKWGNVILPSGQRLRGELFDDPSVQAVLAPVLDRFVAWLKFPRIKHLPWSPGRTEDDLVHTSTSLLALAAADVVITEKLDGENFSLYSDYLHARSPTGRSRPDQSWLRRWHSEHAADIPPKWRLCGEYLFATHSIHYRALQSYFYLFAVFNERNVALPWADTADWAALLGCPTVPVLYQGPWDVSAITAHNYHHRERPFEGYVIRPSGALTYREYPQLAAKYVVSRPTTSAHWRHERIVPNELAKL